MLRGAEQDEMPRLSPRQEVEREGTDCKGIAASLLSKRLILTLCYNPYFELLREPSY